MFNFVSITNSTLWGGLEDKPEPDIEDTPLGEVIPVVQPHLHYDETTGAARDVSKVGVSGSEAKLETGTTETTKGIEMILKHELEPWLSDE